MTKEQAAAKDKVEPPRLTEAERLALRTLVVHEDALNQTLSAVLSMHTQSMERLRPLKDEFWRQVRVRLGTDEQTLSADVDTGVITMGREAVEKLTMGERARAFGLNWP